MSDTTESPDAQPAKASPIEHRTFADVLEGLIGAVFTIVNPESYEDAPVGHQIRAGYYRAKLTGLGQDYLIVVTEYQHSGKEKSKEPCKQFIPFARIKRLSLMKSERLIHI